ncbi:MAG: hypothetical protein NTU95_07510 [Methanothrix sp.]|nr:hypothetical protein [Methanothrix sp.]
MHRSAAGDRRKALAEGSPCTRGSQGGAAATRAGDADLAEAEALRLDDLKEISVKESRKGSCTYRMDGARNDMTCRLGERKEDRRRRSPPEG